MNEHEWLTQQFEASRAHLRVVAYRMLGDISEADDAVQESWLRFSRSNTSDVANLGGWLTTVVARVCLDMLRARTARREDSLDEHVSARIVSRVAGTDPEGEALLADSIGLALLVVLDTLTPAERLAFVLHDVFAMPFDAIAPIVERSPSAARQLASRARRRVQGVPSVPDADRIRQRAVVDAFLTAARTGDFNALLAVLDPDVVFRGDRVPGQVGATSVRGAEAVAKQAIKGGARAARAALVNGAVGIVVAPRGHLMMVLDVTIKHGKIVAIDVVAEPTRLRQVQLAVLIDS